MASVRRLSGGSLSARGRGLERQRAGRGQRGGREARRPPVLRFLPTDQWGQKAIRRKTTGTGRMQYMKTVARRFKNGFREGEHRPVLRAALKELLWSGASAGKPDSFASSTGGPS